MKPTELYNGPAIRTEKNQLYCLTAHIYESRLDEVDWSKNQEVEVRYYIDECFDGERGLAVFSVWFKGCPFMLCAEAGRGNRDLASRYITNGAVFNAFLTYVATLLPPLQNTDLVDPEIDLPQLDEYYGCKTADFYDPTAVSKFKTGDIVLGCVMENHLRDAYAGNKTVWVWTRCQVARVNPFNRKHTYHLQQMDRRWETEEETAAREGKETEMITAQDRGNVGATGNDKLVKPYPPNAPLVQIRTEPPTIP
jgi:hypothetical protein